MYRFVESVCVENGVAKLLNLHQDRMEKAFAVYYPDKEPWQLSAILKERSDKGLYKARFLYTDQQYHVEYKEYQATSIESLKVVASSEIEYEFKTLERSSLASLFDQRGRAGDIMIAKNGLITDSYYANLAFFDGQSWFTPENPLLKGVKREYLIQQGVIRPRAISLADLPNFQKVSLINAMLDLGQVEVPIESIVF